MQEVKHTTSKDKTKNKVAPIILAGDRQNYCKIPFQSDTSKRKLGCQGGPYNSVLSVSRVVKCDVIKIRICELIGFVEII